MKATLCRERRPRRSAAGAIRHAPRPANSQPSHCRERACPVRAAHGPTWENPGECATRLRIRPGLSDIGAFHAGRGKPLPYGGDACEFAQYCGKLGRCCAERRGRRSLPGVCGFAIGGSKPFPSAAGAVGDAGPYRHRCLLFLPFLPPAGEGGIRRSPARRMTEEGEPNRQQTVQSFAHPHSCVHFRIAIPSRSPSPVALVGDTLPRWGRDRERALCFVGFGVQPMTGPTQLRQRYCQPSVNLHTPCRARRPRRAAQRSQLPPQLRANPRNAGQCVCGFARMHSRGETQLRNDKDGVPCFDLISAHTVPADTLSL